MDVSRFTDQRTGHLVQISDKPREWAFIPDSLPREWEVSPSLWPLLAEAKQELGRLDGIGQTVPNNELLLRPLQRREALKSSSLEGTYASPEELLLFELSPRLPESQNDPVNDWLEVSNYGRALREGIAMLDKYSLSLRTIRSMHELLLNNVRGRERAPGEFRRNQVHVGSDRRYVPPPSNELQRCLDDFEQFLNEESSPIDPLIRSYMAHYQFEAIHPFLDGNGRVGRALLALTIYQWSNVSKPWLYMSPFFERHKDEYIDLLFRVSSEGAWTQWLQFCLRGTISECKDAIRRCDALRKLKEKLVRKAQPIGGSRTYLIVERLFENPVVSVTDLQRHFSVTYPTAKADVEKLVSVGILQELIGIRPRAFFCPEIVQIAYED